MTLTAYTKIRPEIALETLWSRVENAFPTEENRIYFNEIGQRKNPDSVKESLCALLVLAELLKKTQINYSEFVLARGENGKPHFKNSKIEFSLSHSHGYAAAAVSDKSKVGIDIETADISREKAQKLAERFFSENEKQKLNASPDDFLKIWTKKEAFAKMQGVNLADLVSYEKKNGTSERKNMCFHEFKADEYPMTLCLENPDEITDIYMINI